MLTDIAIKKLLTPTTRREVPDGKIAGLYLVLQPSGAKSWALRYRLHGVPRKLTLGAYPDLSLGEARRKAEEARGAVAGGKDPAQEKQAEKTAAKAAQATKDRVTDVVEAFANEHLSARKASYRTEAKRLLTKEIVPAFGNRRLGEITENDFLRLRNSIAKRSAATAKHVDAVFRSMCSWAKSAEGGRLIAVSPVDDLKRLKALESRDRVLSDEEIWLAWRAFDALGWPFGHVGKLLLLTGQRRGEVAGMRWSEIDLDGKTWTLPAERSKNRKAHTVPLSDAAVDVLKALPRIGEKRDAFVFSTTMRSAVSGFSRAKDEVDSAIRQALEADAADCGEPDAVKAPAPWRLHDLRRTVATGLQKLGVRLEVTEAVLNHVSGSRAGIVGVYQRHEYDAEKRQALDAWSRRLAAIVSGGGESKVVAFVRK